MRFLTFLPFATAAIGSVAAFYASRRPLRTRRSRTLNKVALTTAVASMPATLAGLGLIVHDLDKALSEPSAAARAFAYKRDAQLASLEKRYGAPIDVWSLTDQPTEWRIGSYWYRCLVPDTDAAPNDVRLLCDPSTSSPAAFVDLSALRTP